jgi:hypothetical protein
VTTSYQDVSLRAWTISSDEKRPLYVGSNPTGLPLRLEEHGRGALITPEDAERFTTTGRLIYGENTCTIFEFPTAITM